MLIYPWILILYYSCTFHLHDSPTGDLAKKQPSITWKPVPAMNIDMDADRTPLMQYELHPSKANIIYNNQSFVCTVTQKHVVAVKMEWRLCNFRLNPWKHIVWSDSIRAEQIPAAGFLLLYVSIEFMSRLYDDVHWRESELEFLQQEYPQEVWQSWISPASLLPLSLYIAIIVYAFGAKT